MDKVFMIYQLNNQHSIADYDKIANIHQGFNLINLTQSIPAKANSQLRLEFIDTWKNPNLKFSRTDQRFDFKFFITDPATFSRICMTYMDWQGEALQTS
jgi:hypothetical protein